MIAFDRITALAIDVVPAVCTAVAACFFIWLAPRVKWVDASEGPDAARKLQRSPIACAGGAAILVGLIASALQHGYGFWSSSRDWSAGALWPAGGLAAAFIVGLADDLLPHGLSAGRKLAGQALAGVVLAAPLIISGLDNVGLLERVLSVTGIVLVAVIAQNAVNTFDNADGAATSLCGVALLLSRCTCAGAVLALLPFNWPHRNRPTRLILGDAGSHLLGILLLLHPATWGAFVLMLFDLARVCVERIRAGQPIWVGDRRHLAHRLQRQGFSGSAIVLRLLVIAAPAVIGCSWDLVALPGEPEGHWVLWCAVGAVATLVLFSVAVLWTRPRAALVSGSGSPPQPAGVHRVQ